MTMLSPGATYHAELREQLSTVGRALTAQLAVLWLARGIAGGALVVLGLVIWSWLQQGSIALTPVPLLVAIPVGLGIVGALATLLVRQPFPELARRVDRAARLSERSTTALELGARGDDFPLALAQMRDAVEHLRRVDLLEAFPLKLPRTELMTAFFVVVIAGLVAVSPNPWLLRARAANPAITIAHEQAQRVQREADAIQTNGSPDLDALRTLLTRGARTVDARSNEPDAALNALQDLEDQVRQMSAGDDQVAAALAAIASALAADPATQSLSNAINTGDMRQIAQATRDLAQTTAGMSSPDQQRVSRVLRDASGRAARSSQSVASELSSAADALDASAGGDAGGGAQTTSGAAPARDALNNLANNASAVNQRQRAASQLESSRNALERALGRTQSRSGTSGRSSSSSQNSGSRANQPSGEQSDSGAGQGLSGDGGSSAESGDRSGASSPANADQNGGGDRSGGSGYSTGGQNLNRTGPVTTLDTITTPQQVPSAGEATPDQSSSNPYLGQAGTGSAQTQAQDVAPAYSNRPTTGNDSGSIPIGLRDLVKDYFSSLDQKGF